MSGVREMQSLGELSTNPNFNLITQARTKLSSRQKMNTLVKVLIGLALFVTIVLAISKYKAYQHVWSLPCSYWLDKYSTGYFIQSMLIIFIWLGSVLPERYTQVISHCQSYPGNRCVLLQEVHERILLNKYKDLLHLSQLRLDSLIMVERADILRLLYLYDKGGIYSDLDNQINYKCLEDFTSNNEETFYFGQEQFNNSKPSNNFIYSPTPQHPQLKRVIQKIHQCEECQSLDFASPYFLHRIGVPFKNLKDCIKHGYESTWFWWTHNSSLKSPEKAKQLALKREKQDKAAANDPAKMKAFADQRVKEKQTLNSNFLKDQKEAEFRNVKNYLADCRAGTTSLNETKNLLFVALVVTSAAFCGLTLYNILTYLKRKNKIHDRGETPHFETIPERNKNMDEDNFSREANE